jgi:hypothetical protein
MVLGFKFNTYEGFNTYKACALLLEPCLQP